MKRKTPVAVNSRTDIVTSVTINTDTYDRARKFMTDEYKRTGERTFLKDIISPAIDLYINMMGSGNAVQSGG